MGSKPDQGEGHQVQREIDMVITGLLSEKWLAISSGASKLRMPQIRGWVAKGSGLEVEDVMVRFGWLRENGPGATMMVEVNGVRIEGSR